MLLDHTETATYEEFLALLSIDEHEQIYAPFQPTPSPSRLSKMEIKPLDNTVFS